MDDFPECDQMTHNGSAMNSTGAKRRLPSAKHIADSFCFDLFFSVQSKIQKILRSF
tara:strand:+ start:758 stop:925 length:168 start_codon:yes stop_codon:yes gene_type:complete